MRRVSCASCAKLVGLNKVGMGVILALLVLLLPAVRHRPQSVLQVELSVPLPVRKVTTRVSNWQVEFWVPISTSGARDFMVKAVHG